MLPLRLQQIRQRHSKEIIIENVEKNIINSYRNFMIFFNSWIPYESFIAMPIPVFFDLFFFIAEESEKKRDKKWPTKR